MHTPVVVPPTKASSQAKDDDSNPFLEGPFISQRPKDWTRRSMGFVISPTSHFSKTSLSQIQAYGIGIEVEMDLDKDMGTNKVWELQNDWELQNTVL
jgi:hypothetical protein